MLVVLALVLMEVPTTEGEEEAVVVPRKRLPLLITTEGKAAAGLPLALVLALDPPPDMEPEATEDRKVASGARGTDESEEETAAPASAAVAAAIPLIIAGCC